MTFKTIVKLAILISVALIVAYMILVPIMNRDNRQGLATMVLLKVAADAIDAYYADTGVMPEAEDGKLPVALLEPKNYIRDAYHNTMGDQTCRGKL